MKLTLLVALCLALGPGGNECDEGDKVDEGDKGSPVVTKPKDCAEILMSGHNSSGVYTIWPINRLFKNKSLEVYCDMDTDGGGWTVIKRRGNFSNPKDYFCKGWEQYKLGFGNLTEEFWLGNDNIYALSNQASSMARFDLRDAEGNVGYTKYNSFWIDDEKNGYTLHVAGYLEGNVGNAKELHGNFKFSTKYSDNDLSGGNCTVDRKGAWWYEKCGQSNLNGLNQPGVDSTEGIQRRENVCLAGVEIKLKPN